MMSVVAEKVQPADDQTPIEYTTPDRPLSTVARRWLKKSLGEVTSGVRRAARKRGSTGQHEQALPMAARRASVAIEMYAEMLPKRRAERILRELTLLRRSASKARDLDALAQRLERADEPSTQHVLSDTLNRVEAKRRIAHASLRNVFDRWKRKRLKRQIKRLLQRVKWRGEGTEQSFASFARSKLLAIADAFFASASADVSEITALYEMYSFGRRLQLATEALASEFDPTLREQLMGSILQMQQALAAVANRASAKSALTRWSEKAATTDDREELADCLSHEEHALQQSYEAFRVFWTAQRSEKIRSQFDVLFAFLDDR